MAKSRINGKRICTKCFTEVKCIIPLDRLADNVWGEEWICPNCGIVPEVKIVKK